MCGSVMAQGKETTRTGVEPIEFWFDFSSPYAYFASLEIEALAARHQRQALWRPFLLGSAFKLTGSLGLSRTPLKREYARHDWRRIAACKGIPFALPSYHPATALPATRAYYHLELSAPDRAVDFAKAALAGYFTAQLDTSDIDAVAALAGEHGMDEADLKAGITDPLVKHHTRRLGEEAIARGVFGSPWFFVGEEPFWGWDRLPMMERWLERGNN